jgi:membrane-associated protein
MIDLSGDIFSMILSNGAPFLGVLLLLGAIGVPVPTTLLVMDSGALVRLGMLDTGSALIGLGFVVAGDSLSYAMGRLGHGRLKQRFHSNRGWKRALQTFQTRGDVAIYLTRWLVPSIAIPTNLLAGGSGYRYDRFLLLSSLGEITWIGIFGGLGYTLGSQWETVTQYLPDLTSLTLIVTILLACVYWGVKKTRLRMNQTGLSEDRPGARQIRLV